jgi:DNA-binding transcriptional ArsR family regulator
MLYVYNTLFDPDVSAVNIDPTTNTGDGNLPKEDKYDLIFKALGDSRRREILDLLKERPRTTGELIKRFKQLDRCTVMQHLSVLEKADLVIVKREGRLRWNYLNPLPLKELHDRWIGAYANVAIDLLARMKREIEGY